MAPFPPTNSRFRQRYCTKQPKYYSHKKLISEKRKFDILIIAIYVAEMKDLKFLVSGKAKL